MLEPIRDANYWRKRAAATRAKAEERSVFRKPRVNLLKVAEEYERLAERVERRRHIEPAGTSTFSQ